MWCIKFGTDLSEISGYPTPFWESAGSRGRAAVVGSQVVKPVQKGNKAPISWASLLKQRCLQLCVFLNSTHLAPVAFRFPRDKGAPGLSLLNLHVCQLLLYCFVRLLLVFRSSDNDCLERLVGYSTLYVHWDNGPMVSEAICMFLGVVPPLYTMALISLYRSTWPDL